MTTVLEEKKPNILLFAILIISLLCVGASGYMWYKANNIGDTNAIKVAELEKAVKSLNENVNKQNDIISNLNTQLQNASKEKTMLLAEIDTLKAAASKPVEQPVVAPKPQPADDLVESISAVAYFDFGKAELKDEFKAELDKVADLIIKKKSALVIEGHTDPIGDKDYNVWLSKERADSVKNYILSKTDPVKPCNIIAIGVGSQKQKDIKVPNKDKRKVLVTAVEDCKGAL